MKKTILISTLILILITIIYMNIWIIRCFEPYRVVQMENGEYVIQRKDEPSILFFTFWTTVYEVPVANKKQACKARDELIAKYKENRKSITIKKIIK